MSLPQLKTFPFVQKENGDLWKLMMSYMVRCFSDLRLEGHACERHSPKGAAATQRSLSRDSNKTRRSRTSPVDWKEKRERNKAFCKHDSKSSQPPPHELKKKKEMKEKKKHKNIWLFFFFESFFLSTFDFVSLISFFLLPNLKRTDSRPKWQEFTIFPSPFPRSNFQSDTEKNFHTLFFFFFFYSFQLLVKINQHHTVHISCTCWWDRLPAGGQAFRRKRRRRRKVTYNPCLKCI